MTIRRRVIWRKIFGGFYAVNNYGDVMRLRSASGARCGHVLKPYHGWHHTGPLVVKLCNGDNVEQVLVNDLLDAVFPGRKR